MTQARAHDAVRVPGATVQTAMGRVCGYWSRGVHVFKGMPYAGAPGGPGRFQRAPRLAAWEGVRAAYSYGPVCPSHPQPQDLSSHEWAFLLPRGAHSAALEDCLRINLWVAGDAGQLDAGARRPVMLWLHGQGFMSGSSQDFLGSEGENLARTQGVLVASINHRVGPLGFLHLGELLGDAYADSGNVGMLDVIDALRWLRDNVEAFGGDPHNITVFGQSGGGFKVSVLLAMPEAQGLFHKAIIQSGARLRVHTPDSATALVRATLRELGLDDAQAAALHELPVDRLLAAVHAATRAQAAHARPQPGFRDAPSFYWMPVAGVPSLPWQPFDPVAPAVSREVPLLVGTTLNEAAPAMEAPSLEQMDWPEVARRLAGDLGERCAEAVAAARRLAPGARPVEVLSWLLGRRFRQSAVALCELRCAPGHAPTYNYLFAWRTPQLDGRPGAFHTADINFVFANTDLCAAATGGSERARRLAQRMSGAWAQFARSGVPADAGLPEWPRFTAQQRACMVFDDESRVAHDPDGELLRVLPG